MTALTFMTVQATGGYTTLRGTTSSLLQVVSRNRGLPFL